jgi:hypothetical protein
VHRTINLIDLVKSFPTRVWLQKSASIQPGTSPSKFGSQISQLAYCRSHTEQRRATSLCNKCDFSPRCDETL